MFVSTCSRRGSILSSLSEVLSDSLIVVGLEVIAHMTSPTHHFEPKGVTIQVTNINGCRQDVCSCGSWLDHWKQFSGRDLPAYCPEEKCLEKPQVGAHVQVESDVDKNWYIIPLCRTHGGRTGEGLTVPDWLPLVSADVVETCGREKRMVLALAPPGKETDPGTVKENSSTDGRGGIRE
jgi:hypothetical protein